MIHYITLRAIAHATEDVSRVRAALDFFLSGAGVREDSKLIEEIQAEGHHGNPIILFTAQLSDKKTLPAVLRRIGSALSSLDKEELCRELKLHLEKRNLYLRFDKQAAFMGTIKFTQTDPIHFKIRFKNKTPEEIAEICTSAGLLL